MIFLMAINVQMKKFTIKIRLSSNPYEKWGLIRS